MFAPHVTVLLPLLVLCALACQSITGFDGHFRSLRCSRATPEGCKASQLGPHADSLGLAGESALERAGEEQVSSMDERTADKNSGQDSHGERTESGQKEFAALMRGSQRHASEELDVHSEPKQYSLTHVAHPRRMYALQIDSHARRSTPEIFSNIRQRLKSSQEVWGAVHKPPHLEGLKEVPSTSTATMGVRNCQILPLLQWHVYLSQGKCLLAASTQLEPGKFWREGSVLVNEEPEVGRSKATIWQSLNDSEYIRLNCQSSYGVWVRGKCGNPTNKMSYVHVNTHLAIYQMSRSVYYVVLPSFDFCSVTQEQIKTDDNGATGEGKSETLSLMPVRKTSTRVLFRSPNLLPGAEYKVQAKCKTESPDNEVSVMYVYKAKRLAFKKWRVLKFAAV